MKQQQAVEAILSRLIQLCKFPEDKCRRVSVVCLAPLCLNGLPTASQHAPDETDGLPDLDEGVSQLLNHLWGDMVAETGSARFDSGLGERRPVNSISVLIQ